ncbi:phosphomannomutase/phosphoglucomutase [Patescibacteria group bacterium]|nr:phosphomannomutase/phosphoglucomutase [Patescibacteria group bacterium]
MNPNIFRAYDIRGIVGKDFQVQDAGLVGKAFGSYIRNQGGESVVVGHDNRFTSDELNAYLVEGLLSTGCHIIDLGLSLTPLVHYAVIKYLADGGIIITGSHNPKEFNGFRFDLKNAVPFFNQDLQNLYQLILGKDFVSGQGSIDYDDGQLFNHYINDIKGRIFLKRPINAVIDCGNGTTSAFAVRLFQELGCQVTQLYCNLHGDYPYHQPNPEEIITMQDLQKTVLDKNADLGIAFDTDGDRSGFVDEKGKTYETDKILIMFAQDILARHPGSKVLYDVKASYVLGEEIKKLGGIPQMMRTGHTYFRKAITESDNIFLAGELSSHTFIKDNYYGFDDGLYAAARLIEILSKSDRTFSDHFKGVKETTHTQELKAPCPDEDKFRIVDQIKENFRQRWEIIDIDGARVIFSPTAWALVRASNTSPSISLRFEASNQQELYEIVEIVKSRLSAYPVIDLSCLEELQGNGKKSPKHE